MNAVEIPSPFFPGTLAFELESNSNSQLISPRGHYNLNLSRVPNLFQLDAFEFDFECLAYFPPPPSDVTSRIKSDFPNEVAQTRLNWIRIPS